MCTGAIAPEVFVSYDVHGQCQQNRAMKRSDVFRAYDGMGLYEVKTG